MASAVMASSQNQFKNRAVYKADHWAYSPPKPFDPKAALIALKATFGGAKRRKRKLLT